MIDPGISRITVRVFATGLLSALGHSPTISVSDFKGEVRMSQESLDGAGLHLTISAASLRVQDAVSDRDRREMERQMKDQVLEAERFPEIVYLCSRVSGSQVSPGQSVVRLDGQLTLHGVTRDQPIDARLNVTGSLLRTLGEVALRQTDYGIKLVCHGRHVESERRIEAGF